MESLPLFPKPLAIDGFLQRQGAAGDWLPGPGGGNNFIITSSGIPLVPLSFRFIDKFNSTQDEVFSKGYLQDDPNKMKWDFRRATSKTDINNILFFIAINPVDNHIWVAMAADRRSTGKNSTIDFEFLQRPVFMTGDSISGADRGFYSFGTHGGRTIGDLVISVGFQNTAGSFSSVQYFQWQPTDVPSTYAYYPINPPAGTGFAATNTATIQVPFGAFGSTTYAPYTFVETAIDVAVLMQGGSIWVKSKSNDNYDDFYPPLQYSQTFGYGIIPLSVSYSFLDLYTAQINADVSPNNPSDYNFRWQPIGATNGIIFDRNITGSLSNYNIPNPVFTSEVDHECFSYIYELTVSPVNGFGFLPTYVVINPPCKIGKPINPDEMQQGEILNEESNVETEELNVFPNPVKSGAAITLNNNNPRDIQIIDMNGKVVQERTSLSSNTLDLKNLPAGIYLLRSYSRATKKTTTKKLIITN